MLFTNKTTLSRPVKLILLLPILAAAMMSQTGCWQGTILSDTHFTVSSDPAGHAQFINMPRDATIHILEVFALGLLRDNSSTPQAATQPDRIQVTGSSPWVTVSGPLNSDGSFSLTGSGIVAGYPLVAVTFVGTVDLTGKITGSYSMGTNGALPTGQAITYSVTGQVTIPSGTPLISPKPGSLQFTTPVGANPPSQALQIANGGTGTLGWTATASTDSGGNWLSIDSSGSVAPSTVNVAVTSANLARGTYTGKISIVGLPQGGVPNSPQQVKVQLSVGVPVVNVNGIVNNASYNLGSSSIAPGSIAAIFGTSLTDGTSCLPPSCNPAFGSNGKLNAAMAGAQATVNGTPVPIFYAAPAQLGIQIPYEVTGTSATVAVSVSGQTSTPATINLAPFAPGIFTATADGKGAGAITHVDGSAVTVQNPAHAGELVILYATGLGQVAPAVPTGALPAGASNTVSPVTVTIGGINAIPDFAGLAGCCVGLNQINVQIPNGVNTGNSVPVVLSIGGQASNTATIAVQ